MKFGVVDRNAGLHATQAKTSRSSGAGIASSIQRIDLEQPNGLPSEPSRGRT